MSKFTTVPDFANNIQSMAEALRAMKDIIEQLAGLRQGDALAAPQMFMQDNEPVSTGRVQLKNGDIWYVPNTSRIKIRKSDAWVEIKASP